jgi:hypothetical protein
MDKYVYQIFGGGQILHVLTVEAENTDDAMKQVRQFIRTDPLAQHATYIKHGRGIYNV